MASFELNGTKHEIPASKSDFSALIDKLSAGHAGLRERALVFALRTGSGSESRSLASMVGEGKYGTLHLLHEVLGRPDLEKAGFVEVALSTNQLGSMLAAFTPFAGDGQSHPNIEFLKEAQESKAVITATILGQASDALKANARYTQFRTNFLFSLFNEGALRGSDGAARQALLDSFSFLPNNYLTAEGQFLSNQAIREGACVTESAAGSAIGGVDKFPSLMAVRAERLKADGNRIVPSAMIRDGVHVGKRNIFMFHAAVNIAAYIGDDNMVDSHASIASAAQIGNKNKIGSFVSMEGVLSPANAVPVYVGDENFIGSFARIGTGIIVGSRNFIGAGVNLSKGTKLKDCRETSPTRGQYLNAQDLNGSFNDMALAPNNAARDFNGVSLLPGEYILFENSEEFMRRFEGDDRIKAKS